jgi:hypothetical protein
MQLSPPGRFNLLDWTRDLAPSCRDATRLHSRALDESLPLRIRIGLKCHLLLCFSCRRYARQLSFIRQALRRDGDRLAEWPPTTLPPTIRNHLKELLRTQG